MTASHDRVTVSLDRTLLERIRRDARDANRATSQQIEFDYKRLAELERALRAGVRDGATGDR